MKAPLAALTAAVVTLVTWLTPASAFAARLDLDGLAALERHVLCNEKCDAGRHGTEAACRVAEACGQDDPAWEKNNQAPVNRDDLVLARMEVWDGGTGDLVCYRGGAVLPMSSCTRAECVAKHGEAGCKDADGDHLFAWQEALAGTSDQVPQTLCASHAECGGFFNECKVSPNVGVGICQPRVCADGPCTAFRIVQKDLNDQELLVYVYFDFSPTPTALLDLYVTFDPSALKLVDSRPLEAVTSVGKTLAVRQIPGTATQADVRLVVYSPSSSMPIPTGAVAELVFQRTSGAASSVTFTKDLQRRSVATSASPDADFRSQLATARDAASDGLWGKPVVVTRGSDQRLVLDYGFDDTRHPLSYSSARSRDALCAVFGECKGATTPPRKASILAALDALQGGFTFFDGGSHGVYGNGAVFNGLGQHLELPVTMSLTDGAPFSAVNQPSSLSTWFYADAQPDANAPQVVFSHNGPDERTSYGLALTQSSASGSADLRFFEGDVRSLARASARLVATVPLRRWTYAGISVDKLRNQVKVYVDGDLRATFPAASSDSLFTCPMPDGNNPSFVLIHEEGGYVGGKPPEALYYATAENNLFGIEQLDMRSFTRRPVLRLPSASAQDPDFSPIVNKLVYASNASGSYEIWIADGDGGKARAITSGFGDTARRIFARHPKWAPDGSGVVFESNVYNYDRLDNVAYRTYHLYYIPFDATARDVAVNVPGGGTTNVFDYDTFASRTLGPVDTDLGQQPNELDKLRIAAEWASDQTGALFLRGRTPAVPSTPTTPEVPAVPAEVLYTSTDSTTRVPDVRRVKLVDTLSQSVGERAPIGLSSGPQPNGSVAMSHEVTALTAYYRKPAGGAAESAALVRDAWVSYDPSRRFQVNVTSEANGQITTVVKHLRAGYGATCWDTNQNGTCDVGENRAGGHDAQNNPSCSEADCAPSEVSNLYIKFDATIADIVEGATEVLPAVTAAGATKKVTVVPAYGTNADYIAVSFASPTNNAPLPVDTELVRLVFQRKTAGNVGLAAMDRTTQVGLKVIDLENGFRATDFTVERNQGGFDEVLGAAFSPKGDRLLLSVIQKARPTLMLTTNRTSSAGARKVLAEPVKIEGMSWTGVLKYFACNWIGAHRDRDSGQFVGSLRGGMDSLRLYNYVRADEAFRSESERGVDALTEDYRGPKGGDPRTLPGDGTKRCASSLECPTYNVCEAGTCVVKSCDPAVATSCGPGQGHCTLAGVAAAGGRELGWVCSAECETDNQCFQQQCLNGPCRFCDDTKKSCGECRNTTQDLGGGVTLDVVEGCPDRNSFSCDGSGSCVTSCYRFENGNAKYMCDAATEYCRRGKCALLDWDWQDFSPMTFAGVGESTYRDVKPTTVRSQLYPIVINAFGVDDNGQAPEILVEGRSRVRPADWIEIGRVHVYNLTPTEATTKPYTLTTPHKLTELRLRLVTSPLADDSGGATGFMARGRSFCLPNLWGTGAPDLCTHRAPGSRPNVGYPVGISRFDALLDCVRNGSCAASTPEQVSALSYFVANANPQQRQNVEASYLMGGQTTVVVKAVQVNGTDVLTGVGLTSNPICSYEGSDVPQEILTGSVFARRKRVVYGTASQEISNQRAVFPPSASSAKLIDFTARTARGWALLNCNYAIPGTTDVAAATFNLTGVVFQGTTPGNVVETANGCFVQLKGNGNNPGKREPCYEIKNADVVIDAMSSEVDVYKTLEFQKQRSFGYDTAPKADAGR